MVTDDKRGKEIPLLVYEESKKKISKRQKFGLIGLGILFGTNLATYFLTENNKNDICREEKNNITAVNNDFQAKQSDSIETLKLEIKEITQAYKDSLAIERQKNKVMELAKN